MYKYERIIYWSNEDNAFIVEVPELPGCMADGKTIEEAIANAEIIISEWIEVTLERGLEVPEPKGRLMYAWKMWNFVIEKLSPKSWYEIEEIVPDEWDLQIRSLIYYKKNRPISETVSWHIKAQTKILTNNFSMEQQFFWMSILFEEKNQVFYYEFSTFSSNKGWFLTVKGILYMCN